MAVAAGVVGDLLVPTLGTTQDMTAQSRGAAGGQVVQGAALLGRQSRSVAFQELIETAPDDLGHGGPSGRHGWRSPRGLRSRRSSGLRVDGKRRGGHVDSTAPWC